MMVSYSNIQRVFAPVGRMRLKIAVCVLLVAVAAEAWLLSGYPSNWPGHSLVRSQRCSHSQEPSLQVILDPCTDEQYADGHMVKRALDGHVLWQGRMPVPYMPETQCNSWAQCGEK